MTDTLTAFLREKGKDLAEYADLVRRLEDKVKWSWGLFDMTGHSWVLDVARDAATGTCFVLYGNNEWSSRGGGVEYGWSLRSYPLNGEAQTLREEIWRHISDPRKDRPSLNFNTIAEVKRDGEKWDIRLEFRSG